ncbi:MAG TPA: hypothetical protein VGM74_17385 [Burkholderiaceae bacterium]
MAIEYGEPLALNKRVATLEIITMSPRPRVRIAGNSRWHRWYGPNAWKRITRSTSSGSVSATVRPRLPMPALLIRMSIAPKSFSAASAIAAQASRSSTGAR